MPRKAKKSPLSLAQQKVALRTQFMNYLFVIGALWGIYASSMPGVHPWPIYLTLSWGISLIGKYRKLRAQAKPVQAYDETEPQEYLEWWDQQVVNVHERPQVD